MYTGTMAGALGEIGLGRKQFLHAFVNTVPLRKPASLLGGLNSQAVLNGTISIRGNSLKKVNYLRTFHGHLIIHIKTLVGLTGVTGLPRIELRTNIVSTGP